MDIIKNKSDKELLHSVVAELAKAQNEIACAQGDLVKARNRLKFLLVITNDLINRQGDKQI